MPEQLGFFIRHSLNDLRVNGQRTIYALFCIMAGVGAIVSLQTLSTMINNTLTGSLQESNRGDIQVFPQSGFFVEEAVIDEGIEAGILEQPGEGAVVFSEQGIARLTAWFDENYPGSEITYRGSQSVEGFDTLSLAVPERNTSKLPVFAYIVDVEAYPLYGTVETVDDEPLNSVIQTPTDIVVSRSLADDLNAEVGDTVRISGSTTDFTLAGIVPDDAEAGFENIFANLLGYYYLDFGAVELFDNLTPGQGLLLYVRLDNPELVDEAAENLVEEYSFLDTRTTTELEEANSQFSNSVDDLVVVMGLVSLLIGGIGIVNTMLVIVSRRTTEVAVLKTLGLEPQQVTMLFLVEAIIMGVLGSLLGVLLGWGLAFATKGVAEGFLGQSLDFTISVDAAVRGFIVGVVMTAIFGFLPTLAAGQIRPANVLRPSEAVIPRAGRLRSFAAVIV
ncbi:MAG: ABC transporter permease [Anaerolineae bacterium]|nr:ABC transporter permease [Anaerolineae bacterium]